MKKNDKLLYFAIGIVVVCFVYFFCVTFIDVPERARYVDLILGFLIGTALGGIINFYWGSSEGSKNKDKGQLES